MNEPFEEMYFNWLCAKVLSQQPYNPNYRVLLETLHKTEFVWNVIGDKNRADDGLELRIDFLRETHFQRDRDWYEAPCSVLEMLIAFAQRVSFQTDMPAVDWFWRFLANLGLDEYRRVSEDDVVDIQEVIDAFVWRRYRRNGEGGLFPIRHTRCDQREVEIWYQFCEYVEDQGIF